MHVITDSLPLQKKKKKNDLFPIKQATFFYVYTNVGVRLTSQQRSKLEASNTFFTANQNFLEETRNNEMIIWQLIILLKHQLT